MQKVFSGALGILYFCIVSFFLTVLFIGMQQNISLDFFFYPLVFLLFIPIFDAFFSQKDIFSLSKLFFFGALVFFTMVALFFLLGQQSRAEDYSIFAYYAIIGGVIMEIFTSFLRK